MNIRLHNNKVVIFLGKAVRGKVYVCVCVRGGCHSPR